MFTAGPTLYLAALVHGSVPELNAHLPVSDRVAHLGGDARSWIMGRSDWIVLIVVLMSANRPSNFLYNLAMRDHIRWSSSLP
jgi:hypothetical protein